MIAITAWNATKYLPENDIHELYKNVLIQICHTYGQVSVRKQSPSKKFLHKEQIINNHEHHALSTVIKTYCMKHASGCCIRCWNLFKLKKKTRHYCVQCSVTNIIWLCQYCFFVVHSNPKYVTNKYFKTVKPLSAQAPIYSVFE